MSALASSGPPAPAPDRVLVLTFLPASTGKVHAHAAYKRDAEESRAEAELDAGAEAGAEARAWSSRSRLAVILSRSSEILSRSIWYSDVCLSPCAFLSWLR